MVGNGYLYKKWLENGMNDAFVHFMTPLLKINMLCVLFNI